MTKYNSERHYNMHFYQTETDDFDYDVDFYVDNNYEYIDTDEVKTLQDLFERNRLLNDKHRYVIDFDEAFLYATF